MQRKDDSSESSARKRSTRRGFLKDAGVIALGTSAFAWTGTAAGAGIAGSGSKAAGDPAARPVLAYVGTYSSPAAPQEPGDGKGIYLMQLDPHTGDLKQLGVTLNDHNPSWLALHPSGKFLFCVNETEEYEGEKSGSVSAYRIERPGGHLSLLNTVPSGGAGPAHLSVHPSGKYVLVANYGGGTVAVLPAETDGRLRRASYVHHDTGQVGPKHPTSGPPGNFSISGHGHPHAHMFESDPTGHRVVWTDLGLDRIFVANINLENGTLSPDHPPSASLPPGDGPRHFVFHPSGRWMYSVQEEASTVTSWEYNPATGSLKAFQKLSTLPAGFEGTNFPSEIRISPDARFIYVANRDHDSIDYFSVGSGGRLTHRGEEWTRGSQPRSISLDPSGTFIYSLNQRSDAITVFRIHRESGRPVFTGHYIAMGSPACLAFLA